MKCQKCDTGYSDIMHVDCGKVACFKCWNISDDICIFCDKYIESHKEIRHPMDPILDYWADKDYNEKCCIIL